VQERQVAERGVTERGVTESQVNQGQATDGLEAEPVNQEFQDLCLVASQALQEIAVSKASLGDLVGAFACALGSDLYCIQGNLWESIVVNTGTSYRKYFQSGEEIARLLAQPTGIAPQTIAEALTSVRATVGPVLARVGCNNVSESMLDLAPFEEIAKPDASSVRAAVIARLAGMGAHDYVRKQQQAASELSVQAFTASNAGNVDQAIALMYSSDFTYLDSYLVESALAAGDENLFTVTMRWELATYSASLIEELPQSLDSASRTVRGAITRLMGSQDASRFIAMLPRV